MLQKMILKYQQETIEYARKFASKLRGGEVIGLIGELGSGKTTFVKGLAEGLKVEETITSPTFVMLKTYPAKIDTKNIDFVHIDAYRTENIDDIKSAGIEDFLGRDDIVMVVEWAEKIREILPKNTLDIYFKHHNKENYREITIKNFKNDINN
jgi:tRNA threonylcarbamoyladenosine biosynthesis protein TsaE